MIATGWFLNNAWLIPLIPAIRRGTAAAERTISGGHARAQAPVQWTLKSRFSTFQ